MIAKSDWVAVRTVRYGVRWSGGLRGGFRGAGIWMRRAYGLETIWKTEFKVGNSQLFSEKIAA